MDVTLKNKCNSSYTIIRLVLKERKDIRGQREREKKLYQTFKINVNYVKVLEVSLKLYYYNFIEYFDNY